mmetsp:Transcript_68612/g.212713  ORF Transcript_68612/g.212713 Transcript_68612/m.212713 type:complete len:326 (+) Transcript_68612:40-1017(+)
MAVLLVYSCECSGAAEVQLQGRRPLKAAEVQAARGAEPGPRRGKGRQGDVCHEVGLGAREVQSRHTDVLRARHGRRVRRQHRHRRLRAGVCHGPAGRHRGTLRELVQGLDEAAALRANSASATALALPLVLAVAVAPRALGLGRVGARAGPRICSIGLRELPRGLLDKGRVLALACIVRSRPVGEVALMHAPVHESEEVSAQRGLAVEGRRLWRLRHGQRSQERRRPELRPAREGSFADGAAGLLRRWLWAWLSAWGARLPHNGCLTRARQPRRGRPLHRCLGRGRRTWGRGQRPLRRESGGRHAARRRAPTRCRASALALHRRG